MNPHHPRCAPRLAAAVLAAALAGPAFATLGEPEATVDRDAAALSMSAGRQSKALRGAWAVRELRSAKVTVRQYAGADGTVFAVAWDGPAHPDLDTLLGAHAQAYRAAVAAAGPRRARGPRRIVAGNLVVEFGGHGRVLQGRAYLTDALPAGASLDDLQ